MAKISQKSKEAMQEVLPATASLHNPIDVIGDAGADRYEASIRAVINDDNADSILVVLTPQIVTEIEETGKVIRDLSKTTDKPIFAVLLGDHYVKAGLRILYDFKIPAFQDIHDAVSTLKNMTDFAQFQQRKNDLPKIAEFKRNGKYREELNKVLASVKQSKDAARAISEDLASDIAAEFDLPVPKQTVATNLKQAKKFSAAIYPVALKATTEDLAHKTDKKAVFLNIKDESELEESFNKLKEVLTDSGVEEPKFLIQEFIADYEPLFIGANRDGAIDVYQSNEGFGHLLALGYGGIYAEVFSDIELSLTPSTRADIEETLEKTSAWEIMSGARGKDPLATDQALDFIMKVQKMLVTYPQIKSVDFNPVLVTKNKVAAVDIKIFVG
jgi:acetyltransferase